ncbi:MAG: PilZ domain-containing protein, partial [Planctomycetota bacterium]
MVDLSVSGLRVLSKRPRLGSQVVVLHTPRHGDITLAAQVSWRRQLSAREHVIGLAFEEIKPDVLPTVQALITEIAGGESQSRKPSQRQWWLGVATALVGVALVGAGQAAEPMAARGARWFPGGVEPMSPFLPAVWWVGLIGGGLLILTGLTEMRRRPTPKTPTSRPRGQAVPVASGHPRPAPPPSAAAHLERLQHSQRLLNGILESSLG